MSIKPIALSGHSRALTHLQYNREGDLLVSCCKDSSPTLWQARDGRRLGTYEGHHGAVWHCDVSYWSKYLLTASADRTARLWELETGRSLVAYEHGQPVRRVAFQHGPVMSGMTRAFLTVSDQVMGAAPEIAIYELPKTQEELEELIRVSADGNFTAPSKKIIGWSPSSKITNAAWGPLNETIICTGNDGKIVVYDVETGKILKSVQGHKKSIRAMVFDDPVKQLYFMTASADTTASLWDTQTLECLKTYDTGRALNCCAISPTSDHVIMAGGQDAVDVALSRVDPAQFNVRFWSKSMAEELAQIPGHFGPVHSLCYSPDGKTFASGGEDGYIRIHPLGGDIFKALDDAALKA